MSPRGSGKPKGKSGKGRGPAPKPPKQAGKGPKRSGRHGGRGSGSTGRGMRDEFAPRGERDDRPAERWDGGGSDFRPRERGRPRDGARPEPVSAPRAERGRPVRDRTPSDEAPQRRGPRRRDDGGQVCVIARREKKFLVAEPFFARGERFVLGKADAEEGELVLIVPDRQGVPQVTQLLGRPEIAADVIAALLLERDYSREHDERTLAAADEAIRAPDPHADGRRDLTGLPTFTIDPVTAKDFDDAISAEEHPQGALIRVHIADVTSFAVEGGIVDLAGRERATSTYVPGLVAPMLPPQLADDACSLVPGVARRAVTIEMLVADGLCLSAEVYRSTIRSDERLHYDQVDEIFAGKEEPAALIAGPLAIARQVALDLIRQRPQALELDIPEPEFEFGPDGKVTSQRASQHTESHRLIEQLMVLANEQVARILQSNGAPGLYRIHELPEASAAIRLVEQMESLGVPPPPHSDEMTPNEAADLVAECSKVISETVKRAGRGHLALPLLILRALKLAAYSPVNLGHAGLRLGHYCHFTSPIRRYPDIVCHRAVLDLADRGLAKIGADDGDRRPGKGGSGKDRDEDDPLTQLAEHCSDQERASTSIEREADRIAKAFLLQSELLEGSYGKVYRGEVTGIIAAGLFVNFGGGFDGMVPVRTLRGDWWELNPEGTMLYAQGSGAVLHLGDPADVIVDRVDIARGKVDLEAKAIGGDL